MGMTITEKILARHAGKANVEPGDNIWIDVDVLMTHDVCGPGTIDIFKSKFGQDARVWDREKVVIIPDHYIFTKDEMARRNVEVLRGFVKEQDLAYFYDVDTPCYRGVCHVALPEEGHTRPGEVLFGTDSHSCTAGAFGQFATGVGNTDAAFIMGTGKSWGKVPPTMRFVVEGTLPRYLMAKDLILNIIGDIGVDGATYRAMEFCGSTIEAMEMPERMVLPNMAIEAGGKCGIIACDAKTEAYVKARTSKPYEPVAGDADARFLNEYFYKAGAIEPLVATPHSPDNRKMARELADVRPTQAYIGSCTGGKGYDFLRAAEILDGHQVSMRTLIVPATTHADQDLDTLTVNGKTLRQVFADAGCEFGKPNCGACLGGPPDTLGRLHPGDICISATNRNFPGRMGSGKEAQVFLASPLTVAASAIKGHIADPREFMG